MGGRRGVAHINFRFVWQAWRLATSTFVLRGRRGTCSHQLSFCVAGVALGDIDLGFTWQGWRLTSVLRGRCGAWRQPWFYVAGVVLGDIGLGFAWPGWRLQHWAGSRWSPVAPWRFAWQARRVPTLTFVLRGRPGAWRHRPWFCVAGVALGDINLCFAWRAWRLVTSTFVLRDRRGTW